jgi:hypothetical protein
MKPLTVEHNLDEARNRLLNGKKALETDPGRRRKVLRNSPIPILSGESLPGRGSSPCRHSTILEQRSSRRAGASSEAHQAINVRTRHIDLLRLRITKSEEVSKYELSPSCSRVEVQIHCRAL